MPSAAIYGKVSLEPDIELVTRVTVVGKRIVRRETDHHFERTTFGIATQHGQLGPRWDAFSLEGLPDQLIKINNGLVRSKRKGLLVGPRGVLGCDDVAHGQHQQQCNSSTAVQRHQAVPWAERKTRGLAQDRTWCGRWTHTLIPPYWCCTKACSGSLLLCLSVVGHSPGSETQTPFLPLEA